MKMLFNGFDNPLQPDTPEGHLICLETKRLIRIELEKDLARISKIRQRMYGVYKEIKLNK